MSRNKTPNLPLFLEAFFMKRLVAQRHASPATVTSYRDTFRLLLCFAQDRLHRAPATFKLSDLDADFIAAFLDHLESARGNSVPTRNTRLAAIHSFFKFVALEEPSVAHTCQKVLALPTKRAKKKTIDFLDNDEVDALISSPDLNTWTGRRDRALFLLAIQTGLRVSELTGLEVQDVVLSAGAHVRCRGKGRKERCTPLRKEVTRVLRNWVRERGGEPGDPLFPNARGRRMTRDGVAYLLAKHVATATKFCPSLRKKRVTPHVLRHSAAMTLLHAGVDRSVIALWLLHAVTNSFAKFQPILGYVEAALSLAARV